MSDKKEDKKSKWFTKKEVTTPLMILNRLLDLSGDKRLRAKVEKTASLGKKIKKDDKIDSEEDIEKREAEFKERQERRKGKTAKEEDDKKDVKDVKDVKEGTSIESKIPIDFKDIDTIFQDYLEYIIPQLNEIYSVVTKKEDMDVPENTVLITEETLDDENRIINSQKSFFVPEYIAPIKVPPVKI